jgi:hypothetical protein
MKRINLIVFQLLIVFSTGYCQWPQVFGTEYYWATPNHTRETYDKGFLLTLDFESNPNTPYGSCIIKTDINGNELWRKRIGNSSKHLEIKGIAIDPENNIYISGGTAQFDAGRDPFIMKLNPCMEVEWCNIYRSPELDDLGLEMNYVPDLNSLIVNFYYVRYLNAVSIINLNTTGDILWENFYFNNPETGGSMPIGLINSTIDSSFLLYGFTYAWSDSLQYYELKPYWSKIGYDGNLVWEKFRLPESAFNRGITTEEPFFINQHSMISGLLSSPPENNSQVVQLNYRDGAFEWIKTLHQPDTVFVCVLNATTKLNSFIYTGVQYFKTGYNAIGNASLQKNDSLGNFIKEALLPVNFTSVIEDICPTHDNKLLISATHSLTAEDVMLIKYNQNLEYDSLNTEPIVYDSLCPTTINSGTIELACNVITGLINQSDKEISILTLAPNPATDYTVIYLPETIETDNQQGSFNVTSFRSDYVKNLTLQVINLYGQTVLSKPWPDNIKEQVLSVSGWSAGLYLIQIHNSSKILSTGKLLVK